MITRRAFLASSGAAAATARPKGLLIDAHIHLFARDQRRFPFHPNAPYRPDPSASPQDLEDYRKFVAEAGIDRAVVVHPEPYQDDHSYLDHCFANEPGPGFFKGTVLFDPIDPATPGRIRGMVERYPGRIVAMRVHAMNAHGTQPATGGAIKDRDLADPRLREVWKAAGDLGLAVQVHMLPHHAPAVERLARALPAVPVVVDHLGRVGMGGAADYEAVLRLADRRNVYLKYSGWRYSSRQDYPYDDAKPVVRRFYEAFGPDRMLWGGLGYTVADFEANAKLLDRMFDFAPESARAQIRGLTAKKLFRF